MGVPRAAEPDLARASASIASTHCGRPLDDEQVAASAITRSCAPSRTRVVERVPERHLCVAVPQGTTDGQRTRASSGADVVEDERPRCAGDSVCSGTSTSSASDERGGSAPESRAPQPPNTSAGGTALAAIHDAVGASRRPGWSSAVRARSDLGRRVDELIPAAPASTMPSVAVRVADGVPDGHDAAERVAREQGGQRILALAAISCTISANGARFGSAGIAAEPPWPGQVGDERRLCRPASSGATATQFAAAPPRPWTSTIGGSPAPPTK